MKWPFRAFWEVDLFPPFFPDTGKHPFFGDAFLYVMRQSLLRSWTVENFFIGKEAPFPFFVESGEWAFDGNPALLRLKRLFPRLKVSSFFFSH